MAAPADAMAVPAWVSPSVASSCTSWAGGSVSTVSPARAPRSGSPSESRRAVSRFLSPEPSHHALGAALMQLGGAEADEDPQGCCVVLKRVSPALGAEQAAWLVRLRDAPDLVAVVDGELAGQSARLAQFEAAIVVPKHRAKAVETLKRIAFNSYAAAAYRLSLELTVGKAIRGTPADVDRWHRNAAQWGRARNPARRGAVRAARCRRALAAPRKGGRRARPRSGDCPTSPPAGCRSPSVRHRTRRCPREPCRMRRAGRYRSTVPVCPADLPRKATARSIRRDAGGPPARACGQAGPSSRGRVAGRVPRVEALGSAEGSRSGAAVNRAGGGG